MWCHVRLINPTNIHPERINKQDKTIAANLNYSDIEFPVHISDYELIEKRSELNKNVFGYEKKSTPYIFQKNLTLKLLICY